jgi:hypothetical protein
MVSNEKTLMNSLKKVVFGSLFLTAFTANALTVSPARMEVSGDPGKTLSGDFLIINEQNTDQTYYTSVENFEAQGESGTPSFSGASKDGLASWIQVQEKIEIKKGERVKVPFTITIPSNADAGGHFAAVFLTTVPPETQGSEVAIGAKVGMLILLRVSGDIKEGGGVLSFLTTNINKYTTSLPVHFAYRFSNTGNDRVNPYGFITIKNTFGSVTKEINANPSQGNILPNSVRKFEVKWSGDGVLPSSASFFDNVKYQWRNFAIGSYTADLSLQFGTSGTSQSTLSFFIIPWQLILVVLIGLFAVYVVLHLIIKHHDKVIIEQIRRATRRSRGQ